MWNTYHFPEALYNVASEQEKNTSSDRVETFSHEKSQLLHFSKGNIQTNIQLSEMVCSNIDLSNKLPEPMKKEWEQSDNCDQEENFSNNSNLLQPVIVKPTNLVPVLPASSVVKRVVPIPDKNNTSTCT